VSNKVSPPGIEPGTNREQIVCLTLQSTALPTELW